MITSYRRPFFLFFHQFCSFCFLFRYILSLSLSRALSFVGLRVIVLIAVSSVQRIASIHSSYQLFSLRKIAAPFQSFLSTYKNQLIIIMTEAHSHTHTPTKKIEKQLKEQPRIGWTEKKN